MTRGSTSIDTGIGSPPQPMDNDDSILFEMTTLEKSQSLTAYLCSHSRVAPPCIHFSPYATLLLNWINGLWISDFVWPTIGLRSLSRLTKTKRRARWTNDRYTRFAFSCTPPSSPHIQMIIDAPPRLAFDSLRPASNVDAYVLSSSLRMVRYDLPLPNPSPPLVDQIIELVLPPTPNIITPSESSLPAL